MSHRPRRSEAPLGRKISPEKGVRGERDGKTGARVSAIPLGTNETLLESLEDSGQCAKLNRGKLYLAAGE